MIIAAGLIYESVQQNKSQGINTANVVIEITLDFWQLQPRKRSLV